MVSGIAIVGMGCRFPDARSPQELWENSLSQRRAFRSIPPERLRLEDYLSLERETPDSTYSSQAALIEGYQFDRIAFSVAGDTFRAADMTPLRARRLLRRGEARHCCSAFTATLLPSRCLPGVRRVVGEARRHLAPAPALLHEDAAVKT
jgi:hypothetical protein